MTYRDLIDFRPAPGKAKGIKRRDFRGEVTVMGRGKFSVARGKSKELDVDGREEMQV